MNFKYYALWLIVWPFYLFDKLVHIGVKDYFWNEEFWFQRVLIWHDSHYGWKDDTGESYVPVFLDEYNQMGVDQVEAMTDVLNARLVNNPNVIIACTPPTEDYLTRLANPYPERPD